MTESKKTSSKSKLKSQQQTMLDLGSRIQKNPDKNRPPATDLMKKVAEKAPQRRKILKDFSPEEAAAILQKTAAKTNGSKDNSAAILKKKQRDLIYRTKMIAKNMEAGNNDKIILFPSYSEKSEELRWYKLGDFSAQYYAYRMADRMGRNPKVRPDNDRFARMHAIVSISDVDGFIKQAMRLNEIDRHEETLDKIHILYLRKGLSDDEVAILRRTEKMRKEMAHNVLRPKKAAPEVYLAILMLGRQIIKVTNNLERTYRIELGDKIADNVFELMSVYFYYTDKMIDVEEAKRRMRELIFGVRAGMAFLSDMETVNATKVCAIGETVVKLEDLIKEMK